ncbi:WSC-domain-containing protein [Stipitochalara longipes BDJ]|nr:WSC-domain-containing protein [Stipitochalara longipes BDJ]
MAIFKFQSFLVASALIGFSAAHTWGSLGCYTITGNKAVLTQVNTHGELLTPESCQTACIDLGFTMAGTEKGTECWCGNIFKTGSPSHACNSPCSGDSSQMCGGNNRINLYEITTFSEESPKNLDAPEPAWQLVEGQELKRREEEKRYNCKRGFGHVLC